MEQNINSLIHLLQSLDIFDTINNIIHYFKTTLLKSFIIKKSAFYKFNYTTQKFIALNKNDNDSVNIEKLLYNTLKNKDIFINTNILIIPLTYQDKLLACVYFESNKKIVKLNKKELILSIKLCSLVYYHVNLYNLAIKDHLTKIYNIRYFKYKLQEYYQNFRNTKKKFSLVMIDIDHFKHYNDKYGHQIGDKILQTLTVSVTKIIDKNILFARYGGEEFIMLLPDCNLKKAASFAEKIRKTVEQIRINTPDYFWRITISLGVSMFPDDADNPDELINCADMSLYYSKKNGRNRVSAYSYDVKK